MKSENRSNFYKETKQNIDIENIMNGELSLSKILKITLNYAVSIMSADGGGIFLVDSNDGTVHLRARKDIKTSDSIQLLYSKFSIHEFMKLAKPHKPYLINDTKDLIPNIYAKSILCVPIYFRAKAIGLLCVYKLDSRITYNKSQWALISNLVKQTAILTTIRRLDAKTKALSIIKSINNSLLSSTDLPVVLKRIVINALRALKADIIILYEYDTQSPNRYGPPIYAGKVWHDQILRHIRHGKRFEPNPNSLVMKMLKYGKPFYATNAISDWEEGNFYSGLPKDWKDKGIVKRENIESSAGIPLIANGEPVGILFVNYRKLTFFTSSLRDTIELLASISALAIQNARLHQVSKKYMTDLKILNTIGSKLSSNTFHDVYEILETAYLQAQKILDLTNFYVALYNDQTRKYSFPIHFDRFDKMEISILAKMDKSLTEYVRKEKKPIRLNRNTQKILRKEKNIRLIGTEPEVWLGAPMVIENKVIGVMVVQNYESEHSLLDHHLDVLATIASQAAIAIANFRLISKLRNQINAQNGLYAISQQLIHNSLSGEQVLETIIEYAVKLARVKSGQILQYDNHLQKMKVVKEFNLPKSLGTYIGLSHSLAGKVFRTKKAAYTNNYLEEYGAKGREEVRYADYCYSVILLPLIWDNSIIGLLSLSSNKESKHAFTEDDILLLEKFTGPASIALGLIREITFRQSMLDDSPFAIIAANVSGDINQCNDSALRLLNYNSRGELFKKHVADIYWDGLPEAQRIYSLIKSKRMVERLKTEVKDSFGNRIPILLTAVLLKNEINETIGSYGVMEDQRLASSVGQAKDLLDAIKEIHRSDNYKNVIDTILLTLVSLVKVERACIILIKGNAFELAEKIGFTEEFDPALVGPWLSIKHDQIEMVILGVGTNFIEEDSKSAILVPLRSEKEIFGFLYLESSSRIEEQTSKELINLLSEEASIAINKANLIRERELTRDGLFATAHAAAAGQIATGFVHELKNNLYTISLAISNIGDKLAKENRLVNKKVYEDKIKSIEQEMQRSYDLAIRLQKYGQRLAPKMKDVYINDLVEESINLVETAFKRKNIRVEKHLDVRLNNFPDKSTKTFIGHPLKVDPNQIEQVIINLLLNAIDFSRERGRINIRTILNEEEVRIRITDYGVGIKPEDRPLLFKPFHTTKEDGVGLGLYMSRIIIHDNHRGKIEFDSSPDKGTTFVVILPRTNY